jgi:uncharacterized protein YicC (UPF0701 family)
MSGEEKETKDEVASIEGHEEFQRGEEEYLKQMAECNSCEASLLSEALGELEAGRVEEGKKILRAILKKKVEKLKKEEKEKVEEEKLPERPFIKWLKEQLRERPIVKWIKERPLVKALEE